MSTKLVGEAARAHSNLNTFATIVTILEGGHLYDNRTYKAAQRIIAICKQQQQRELRAFDRALGAMVKP